MIYQVATIILTFHVAEDVDRVVPAINDWLNEGHFPPLDDMTPGLGGFHAPRCVTYGANCNWFKEQPFAQFFMAFDWLFPENAVLLVQPENQPTNLYRPAYS